VVCIPYNGEVSDYHINALRESLQRLRLNALLNSLDGALTGGTEAVGARLLQAVLTEVPAFSRSHNPDVLPELARHGRAHVEEVLRLLRGGQAGPLAFVQEHARRRAEQHLPLEATLHAYRSGHKVLSRWLRDSVLRAAAPGEAMQQATAAIVDFAMDYTDAISTTFASSYSAHSLLLADVAGDQRFQLLEILLAGHDESDLRAARILRDGGFLDERHSYCVALLHSVDPTEMLNAARARRLADAVEQAVATLNVRSLVDVHAHKVTVVCAAVRRESGWTAPRASLARQVAAALAQVGIAALAGVSNDVPSTAHVPTAWREAGTALELASVGERVVRFADLPLRRLLLHNAPEDFRRMLPAWTRAFHAADSAASGALVATLRAYADTDMNVLKAAATLGVHPNTVYARLQRVAVLSGLQPRGFAGLSELLIVCDCGPEPAGAA
jgi:hypothetical protein